MEVRGVLRARPGGRLALQLRARLRQVLLRLRRSDALGRRQGHGAELPLQHGSRYAYTRGDSDVISVTAGFRRHLVGKTLRNVFHCYINEIGLRFVGKLMITRTFS